MKVSVIIPNYNNAAWLEKCIESCVLQGKEYLKEIIVVDDHSEDNSPELLRDLSTKHPFLKVYTNPGKGGNSARRFGFEKSSGDFIQWLDSDDQLLPGKFKTQLSCFEQNKLADIVYSDWQMDFWDGNELTHIEKREESQTKDIILDLLENVKWKPLHTYLCKRAIVEKTIWENGWNPDSMVAQDREFFTKAALLGANFVYCPGNFVIYNRWSNSTVSNVKHRENVKHAFILNREFHKLVESSGLISPDNKTKYKQVLNSELLKGCFYFPSLRINRPFSIFRINWKIIHWKMRPFIPFIYIWQHIKLLFS